MTSRKTIATRPFGDYKPEPSGPGKKFSVFQQAQDPQTAPGELIGLSANLEMIEHYTGGSKPDVVTR